MIQLSILIPSTFDREEMLFGLLKSLYDQILEEQAHHKIEIITDVDDGALSIGKKRNMLLQKAKGKYIVFIDSDDEVPEYYISEILKALKTNPDVLGFSGFMTTDNGHKEYFKISKDLPYITMWDADGKREYLRFNNHLSPIKRSIATRVGFKDIRFAEDYDYAKRLKESGLIKTETYIDLPMYHYKYLSNKKEYK